MRRGRTAIIGTNTIEKKETRKKFPRITPAHGRAVNAVRLVFVGTRNAIADIRLVEIVAGELGTNFAVAKESELVRR